MTTFLRICTVFVCFLVSISESGAQPLQTAYVNPDKVFSVSLPDDWSEPAFKPNQKLKFHNPENQKMLISDIEMKQPLAFKNEAFEEFQMSQIEATDEIREKEKSKRSDFVVDHHSGNKGLKFILTEQHFRTVGFQNDSAPAFRTVDSDQFFHANSKPSNMVLQPPATTEAEAKNVVELHQPYKYASLYQSEKGFALRADMKKDVPVTILDFSGKKLFTFTTTAKKEKISIEGGEEEVLTYLNGTPSTNTPYVNMVGILNYSGTTYTSIMGDTLTDVTSISKIHQKIKKDIGIQKLIKEYEDPEEAQSGFFATSTPKVFKLDSLPDAYLVCYKKSGFYLEPLPYFLVVYVTKDSVYPVAGNCSNVSDVYQLDDACFIYSEWEPCDGDESNTTIYQLTKDGFKKEANL